MSNSIAMLKKHEAGAASWKTLFRTYQHNAEVAQREFKLSLEEFKEIVSKSCEFCGSPPTPYNKYVGRSGKVLHRWRQWPSTQASVDRAWINVNGIDRLNNDLGYVHGNCAPCCYICNRMKFKMNRNDFITHCNKIAKKANI